MMPQFEIRAKDGLARLGRMTTSHGTVTTPLVMPVVHPAKSAISPTELRREFGFEMVITNSYIIRSRDEFREKALRAGVHALLDFDGPIMTDSGTFQLYVHSLRPDEIDPIEIVRFQRDIGSDIGTILDVFSEPDAPRSRVEEDVRVSLERAERAVSEKGKMLLAGTVQGGTYVDLREHSAKSLARLDLDVHPVGGTVPMMERYRFSDVVRVTLTSKRWLPPDRPVHLFGCGHPMFFALASLLGCDFFDSASYAKFAQDGRMMLPTGTVHLNEIRELPCECPVCSRTTTDELKRMPADEMAVALMRHNLYTIAAEMRRVRQAILEGRLFELATLRARAHPYLLDALHVFLRHEELLESEETVGKTGSVFYTGPETVLHPTICSFQSRVLERYPFRKTDSILLVPHLGDRPFIDTAPSSIELARAHSPEELLLFFVTPIGVVPFELAYIHPAQQCVFPQSIDPVTLDLAARRVQALLDTINYEHVYWLTRDTPTNVVQDKLQTRCALNVIRSLNEIDVACEGVCAQHTAWTRRELRAVFSHQWALKNTDLLEHPDTQIVFSRSTGKIRYIQHGDAVLFTVVPTTGLMTPTVAGGHALLQAGIDERYRVIIDADAVPFVAAGRSVLAKFVRQVSPDLRHGEEVLVLDSDSRLIGVGRANLSGREMRAFKRGVAVSVRHSMQSVD